MANLSDSEICKFYEGQHVFITGGTGFIGKLLIEKLLRSTKVAAIYLLIRPKKGKDVRTRCEELFRKEIFDKVRSQDPTFMERVKVVESSGANLGLSMSDHHELISTINVVFHVAANVHFFNDIKVAYDNNVGVTKQVIKLCKQMYNLKALVYVSTAYSNSYLPSIDETVYDDVGFDHRKVELLVNSPETKEKFTKRVLEKWSNTYEFSKAMAELLIDDTAKDLPVGIFRPSIVLCTHKDPLPGWTDSFGGPTLFIINMALGFIPGDMAVAALIASAWDVHRNYQNVPIISRKTIPIYNYVSSPDNPITCGEFIRLNINVYGEFYPLSKCFWMPTITSVPQTKLTNFFFSIAYHYIPGFFMDVISLLCFKKPTLVSNYRRFHKLKYHGECSYIRDWTFTNTNVKELWDCLNETDKTIFPFDIATVHWTHYFHSYFRGLRSYLVKEPWDNLPSAKVKAIRLIFAHHAVLALLYFVGVGTLWKLLSACLVELTK
ncbi:fatty acyl-CoA reductase wat-like isoform X2 [Zophobas morio]|uniref:fatty acyl-CoA reductase wat-like isoform X2 n=1 Tax=Zophobas morio TaxID=2755281 RepID=UPI0030827C0B